MNDKDRQILALVLIFIMGILEGIGKGGAPNDKAHDARIKLEGMLREWGKV